MDLIDYFNNWRKDNREGWGLAWYLAAEFCRRFYASHGIVSHVAAHEGLGYYGILLDYVPCKVNGQKPSLGRFTIEGDVEPWAIYPDSVGSHLFPLVQRMKDGVTSEDLLKEAITAFRFPPYPEKTHLHCRHKRWGQSYVLAFELAARLALQFDGSEIQIWNDPIHTENLARKHDPNFGQKDHLGHFLFRYQGRQVLLAGDGRVLIPQGEGSLWELFMAGESESKLAERILDFLRQ